METKHLYAFGPFQIDAAKRRLQRDLQAIPLPGKAFETLLFLVRNSDRLVGKDELMRVLWPDATVEENNLSQSISAIRKALGDSPQQQRYVETVPGWGYRFAAPVVALPDDKPDDQLVAVLPDEAPAPAPGLRHDRKAWALGLALAAILAGAASFYFVSRARSFLTPKAESAPMPKARKSVAVLGFDDLSEGRKDQWLSTALAEMLRTELAAGGTLRIVSGEEVAQFQPEVRTNRKKTESLAPARMQDLDQKLGSDLVIYGSYVTIKDQSRKQIRFDVRLQNAKTGEMIAEIAETGAAGDLFDLVSRAGARLRQHLGISGLSPTETVILRASVPSNSRAQETYSEGLASLRVFDAVRPGAHFAAHRCGSSRRDFGRQSIGGIDGTHPRTAILHDLVRGDAGPSAAVRFRGSGITGDAANDATRCPWRRVTR